MSWAAAVLGVFLGAVVPSPLFWIAALVALIVWRWRQL